eukprot:4459140-Lingulodinium_polyedra.AAC.1
MGKTTTGCPIAGKQKLPFRRKQYPSSRRLEQKRLRVDRGANAEAYKEPPRDARNPYPINAEHLAEAPR